MTPDAPAALVRKVFALLAQAHVAERADRCGWVATYRMKHNSPSASLWSAFPGSTGKTKRSSSTAEQRPETGGRQPL